MTHGLRKLEALLKGNERKLDGRGRVMRLLKQRALDWADDAGGIAYLNNRQQTLLWHTAAVSLMVESILHWSLVQPSLLDGNHEMLAPLRKSLIAYLNAERRGLETLGLKPDKADRVPSLQEYLAARAATSEGGNGAENARSGAQAGENTQGQAQASTEAGTAPTAPDTEVQQ